jgi:bacteriorhodopsin
MSSLPADDSAVDTLTQQHHHHHHGVEDNKGDQVDLGEGDDLTADLDALEQNPVDAENNAITQLFEGVEVPGDYDYGGIVESGDDDASNQGLAETAESLFLLHSAEDSSDSAVATIMADPGPTESDPDPTKSLTEAAGVECCWQKPCAAGTLHAWVERNADVCGKHKLAAPTGAAISKAPAVQRAVVVIPVDDPCLDNHKWHENKVGRFSLYATAGIIGLHAAAFLLHTSQRPSSAQFENRSYHWRLVIPCLISLAAYLYMLADWGKLELESSDINGYFCGRDFFWARYVDWALTTPILILEVCAVVGVGDQTKAWLVVLQVAAVTFLFLGAMASNTHVTIAMGVIAILLLLPLFYCLSGGFERVLATDRASDPKIRSLFVSLCVSVGMLWSLYPLVWFLCDGLKIWSVDSSCLLYGCLDIFAKCIIGDIVLNSQSALTTLYRLDSDDNSQRHAEDDARLSWFRFGYAGNKQPLQPFQPGEVPGTNQSVV